MDSHIKYQVNPIVRSNLDFKLNEIPRFWFDNDPFRTRMFDALSLTFPVGERYFIESVRALRDKITDPELQQRVTDFIKQEAQHGIAHDKMNEQMKHQGMPIDQFIRFLNSRFDMLQKKRSKQYNIAMTAAAEHLTALMAETFYRKKETLAAMHPYVRALFAWHAIEEMEHRDVAYDVMQQVGEVPESLRKFSLLYITLLMFGFSLYRTNVMLKHDGFTGFERTKMMIQGIPWFFGKQGKLSVMHRQYMNWFNQDFHPSQQPIIRQYQTWLDALATTHDPIQAGEAFWQVAL